MIGKIFTDVGIPDVSSLSSSALFMISCGLMILMFKDLKDEFFVNRMPLFRYKFIRWSVYVLLFCTMIATGVLDGGQFIYAGF